MLLSSQGNNKINSNSAKRFFFFWSNFKICTPGRHDQKFIVPVYDRKVDRQTGRKMDNGIKPVVKCGTGEIHIFVQGTS